MTVASALPRADQTKSRRQRRLLEASARGFATVIPVTRRAGDFAMVVSAHVGATALVRLGSTFGLRAEVVPRYYAGEGEGVWVTTYGIGFTSLSKRR